MPTAINLAEAGLRLRRSERMKEQAETCACPIHFGNAADNFSRMRTGRCMHNAFFNRVWALRVLCRITHSIILRCRSYHDYCLFQKELLRCIRPTTMISRSDSRRTRVLESNWSLETSSKTGYAGRKSGTQLQLEGNSPSTTSGGGEYIQIRSSKTSTPEGSLIQWFAHSGMQQRGRELVTVIR